jgi:glycosyltransferase involved in cell wall biosynthesis
MKKVVILQYRLLHYRISLFEALKNACLSKNIQLQLVHGQPTESEEKKLDTGYLSWANVVQNKYITVGGKDILWQPYPSEHRDADLVIQMQENRLLSNYFWLFFKWLHKSKIAYWGHGRNFQADSVNGLREKWKKLLIGKVDWWFAYTQLTHDILLSEEYPDERISVLNNAIDNETFLKDLDFVTANQLTKLRDELGLTKSSQVGLFCGSLYPDKRLDYLIDATDKIHAETPDFHLLVIGDGPSAADIKVATETRHWLHWLGVRKGTEKADYFRLAHLVLNPGAVGLHVLDAFCAGVPMVTTNDARHGPEIAYLKNGENGLIVQGDANVYADAVIYLLKNPTRYEQLKNAALAATKFYTLQNMVDNFADGIERCLLMQKK